MTRTNVSRLLAQAGVSHSVRTYAVDEAHLSGEHTAALLGLPAERVFKTLVLRGARGGVFVCCIPSHEEIDLRKAARAAGDKAAEMLPLGDLLAATGYVRGGCSPIGMRRRYPLYIDETCTLSGEIAVSAGVRGAMVLLSPQALIGYTGAVCADLTRV